MEPRPLEQLSGDSSSTWRFGKSHYYTFAHLLVLVAKDAITHVRLCALMLPAIASRDPLACPGIKEQRCGYGRVQGSILTLLRFLSYGGWKKSCTSWYMVYPLIISLFAIFHSYLTVANWCRISAIHSMIWFVPNYQKKYPEQLELHIALDPNKICKPFGSIGS